MIQRREKLTKTWGNNPSKQSVKVFILQQTLGHHFLISKNNKSVTIVTLTFIILKNQSIKGCNQVLPLLLVLIELTK